MKADIKQRKQVLDSFLKIDEIHYQYQQFAGGMSSDVKRTVVMRGDAVAAIVYNTDTERAILVKQFRIATFEKDGGWLTELMAGVMDEGETEQQSLHREMEEEMGYKPVVAEKIGTFYVSPGYSTERMNLYFVEVNNGSKISSGGGLDAENEDIELVEYSLDELKQLIEKDELRDLKTVMGCRYLLARLSI